MFGVVGLREGWWGGFGLGGFQNCGRDLWFFLKPVCEGLVFWLGVMVAGLVFLRREGGGGGFTFF